MAPEAGGVEAAGQRPRADPEGAEPLPSIPPSPGWSRCQGPGSPAPPPLRAAMPSPRSWEVREKHLAKRDQEAGGGPGPASKASGARDKGRALESGEGMRTQTRLPWGGRSPGAGSPPLVPRKAGWHPPALVRSGLPGRSAGKREKGLRTPAGMRETETRATAGRLQHMPTSGPGVPRAWTNAPAADQHEALPHRGGAPRPVPGVGEGWRLSGSGNPQSQPRGGRRWNRHRFPIRSWARRQRGSGGNALLRSSAGVVF